MAAPEANEIDVGYPFQYFIPSTLYDEEVDEKELEIRAALIETVFLTNYGGVTIDTWSAKHGSYKLIQSEEIIREKIAIALSYMTLQEFDDTFHILINDLNILNCAWWLQESYLYSWKGNAKIILCHQQILKSTQWIYCTNLSESNKRNIKVGLFWNNKTDDINEWSQCETVHVNCQFDNIINSYSCSSKDNQENISRMLSEIVDTFQYKTEEKIIEATTNLDAYQNMDPISFNNMILGLLIVIIINLVYILYKMFKIDGTESKRRMVSLIANKEDTE